MSEPAGQPVARKWSWGRKLLVGFVAFIAFIKGCHWWDSARFSLDRLAGKNASQVIEAVGSPSWAVSFDPYPDKPEVKRVLNAEAIRVVSEGGSGTFCYNRLTLNRYGVHFKNGIVTSVVDATH